MSSIGYICEAEIDEDAEKILREVGEYYGGLKGFQVSTSAHITQNADGIEKNRKTFFHISVARPNKVVLKAEDDSELQFSITSDGEKVYTYIPELGKKYTAQDAPISAEVILSEGFAGLLQESVILSRFLSDDPYKSLTKGVDEASIVGKEKVKGRKTNHIRLVQRDVDLDLWFEAGTKPLLRKVVIDATKQLTRTSSGREGDKIETVIEYDNWELDPEYDSENFEFNKPQDSVLVASFFEQPQLLGKDAPPFELALFEGKTMNLAKHKGKDIVILDFWASWCRPCRMAMPVIVAVAKEYEKKGVVLYTVNQMESPEAISSFLNQTGLDCQVALDSDGRVSNLYDVDSIPRTVIIGKDGTVQAIHKGFSGALENQLSSELDTLLQGKKLVGN